MEERPEQPNASIKKKKDSYKNLTKNKIRNFPLALKLEHKRGSQQQMETCPTDKNRYFSKAKFYFKILCVTKVRDYINMYIYEFFNIIIKKYLYTKKQSMKIIVYV